MKNYDCLKLENQLCFPLYACSKAVTRHYTPLLNTLDLTYTQYITMMAMWEKERMNVKELGELLYLDSGTLTPVLKKLESKGYISRRRLPEDERNVIIEITERGMTLRDEAVKVPQEMGSCINLSEQDAKELYRILYSMLDSLD